MDIFLDAILSQSVTNLADIVSQIFLKPVFSSLFSLLVFILTIPHWKECNSQELSVLYHQTSRFRFVLYTTGRWIFNKQISPQCKTFLRFPAVHRTKTKLFHLVCKSLCDLVSDDLSIFTCFYSLPPQPSPTIAKCYQYYCIFLCMHLEVLYIRPWCCLFTWDYLSYLHPLPN